MAIVWAILGLLLIFAVLLDAFETIVLPHRVARRVRFTSIFYRLTWKPWTGVGRRISKGQDRSNLRETFFSFYGPLSLLFLIILWALALVLGFALMQFALGPDLIAPEKNLTFGTYLYMSGTTFFTLGFGDVTPTRALGRLVSVWEGGTGFGFLALVIGYLPVIYQSFSRREVSISMLDARAGSPPSAFMLLNRNCREDKSNLKQFLNEWERWSADILESHLSYPLLCYFRSQHENQSWLSSLTVILDTCALIMVGVDEMPTQSARLTFAMARHTAVDLSQIFGINPNQVDKADRLLPQQLAQLRVRLQEVGINLREGPVVDQQLAELRRLYEPYVMGLANSLALALPPWLPPTDSEDNWQRTAWREDRNPLF